jgi:hypothetical protein
VDLVEDSRVDCRIERATVFMSIRCVHFGGCVSPLVLEERFFRHWIALCTCFGRLAQKHCRENHFVGLGCDCAGKPLYDFMYDVSNQAGDDAVHQKLF